MGLEVIYVTRHGFRSNWAVNPSTGEYTASISSPTGIAADPTLTSHGVSQAKQLAARLRTVQPRIEKVYSSPYYRCLQTIEPFVSQEGHPIKGEPGVGEWYGAAPFEHPTSAAPKLLQTMFPALDLDYKPVTQPTRMGESLSELHDRVAATMQGIISQCDRDGTKAVLICTHAAVVIALGRVLTGAMPDNVEVEDFRAFTCGLSVYRRKGAVDAVETNRSGQIEGDQGAAVASEKASGTTKTPHRGAGPSLPQTSRENQARAPSWRGRGVAGGWGCTANSDCSHLSDGEERGWRFSGDEAFIAMAKGGDDAGLELGVVVESKTVRTSSTNSRL